MLRMGLSNLCVSNNGRFNWAARKLYRRLLQLGADEIHSGGEADQQHPEGYASYSYIPDFHPLTIAIGSRERLFHG